MEKIEPYYQARAKDFVDSMFDAKVFNEKMTRDNMQGYEDLLAFLMQSESKSHYKMVEFTYKYKNR